MSSKISCDIAKDLIPLYIDGVLSKDSEDAVKEHLDGCKDCQKLIDNVENVDVGEVNGDGVKLFDKVGKKFKREYIKKFIIAIVVFLIVWFGATIYVVEHYNPIWPKSSVEGLETNLEVVMIDGDYYVHQMDIYAIGEVCVVSYNPEEAGEYNFFLGEQGIKTLMPWIRGYNMGERYQFLCHGDKVDKINYCKADGTVIFTMWQQGDEVRVLELK